MRSPFQMSSSCNNVFLCGIIIVNNECVRSAAEDENKHRFVVEHLTNDNLGIKISPSVITDVNGNTTDIWKKIEIIAMRKQMLLRIMFKFTP